MTEEKKSSRIRGIIAAVKDFVYGMAVHDMVRYMLKTRMYLEHLFMLMTMGDMLGIPVLPPYYSLKILPYLTPKIANWKRRMFKERDLTDMLF